MFFIMNKDLTKFTKIDENEVYVICTQKVFNKAILDHVRRSELIEILMSEKFIDIDRINERLGFPVIEVDDSISLLTILEYYDIDYLELIQRRLRNVGITRCCLIYLIQNILTPETFRDVVSIFEAITENDKFINLWCKASHLLSSVDDLLQIFDIDYLMFKNVDENELIVAEVGDDVNYPERVIRFENFID